VILYHFFVSVALLKDRNSSFGTATTYRLQDPDF